jgi:hypothetical protein
MALGFVRVCVDGGASGVSAVEEDCGGAVVLDASTVK